MKQKLHFISGMPRSGTTLLAAILRQNPRFHASISTPLAVVVAGTLRTMSLHEAENLISDPQRENVLRGVIESFWSHLSEKGVIFDTNRMWCAMLPTLAALAPSSRVICCVRNPSWIADSFERLVQKNALLASRLFPVKGEIGNVYARYDLLFKNGLIGTSIKNIRQAWFSEYSDRLIAIRYDSLVAQPAAVIGKLYALLQEEPFPHDFEQVEYAETEFDARLAAPGLHRITGRVEPRPRKTILPPELFKQSYSAFWDSPNENPRGVIVL